MKIASNGGMNVLSVCEPGGSALFSATCTEWDTGRVPAWSELARWAPHTHGPDCSCWPTPTARDAERGAGWEDEPGRPLSEVLGGPPNPTWLEWLMGFPEGWTDVGPSGTPSSSRSPEHIGRLIMSAHVSNLATA